MEDEFLHTIKKLDRLSMQFDYVNRAFSVAIRAFERIIDVEEKLGRGNSASNNIASKALKSILALIEETNIEDEDEKLNI